MTSTVIFIAGLAGGTVVGAIIAGVCLLERPRYWATAIRLPPHLHRQLRHAAKQRHRSLSTEIIGRLQSTFRPQPTAKIFDFDQHTRGQP